MSIETLTAKATQFGHQKIVDLWLADKKIKSTDLIFISALKSDLNWELFLKSLLRTIELKASYSESLKILELCTDLLLMGHQEALFEKTQSLHDWLIHLKNLRYPVTSQRDDHLKSKLEGLPWPYGSKTKFERRGDRAGVELKLFITSEADLIKIISSLERVKEQINE